MATSNVVYTHGGGSGTLTPSIPPPAPGPNRQEQGYYKDGVYQPRGNPLDQTVPQKADQGFTLPEDKYPYSGLPESYRDQLLSFVMPQLQNSVQNYPQNIDDYTQNALGTYRQELDRSMKDMIPQQINQLANRGVLSSTVASDTLSRTASRAITQSATKGYETAMQASMLKAGIPATLSGLLQYGQSSQDPSVMYRTMAELLASL
jgi:hypothetical protein